MPAACLPLATYSGARNNYASILITTRPFAWLAAVGRDGSMSGRLSRSARDVICLLCVCNLAWPFLLASTELSQTSAYMSLHLLMTAAQVLLYSAQSALPRFVTRGCGTRINCAAWRRDAILGSRDQAGSIQRRNIALHLSMPLWVKYVI